MSRETESLFAAVRAGIRIDPDEPTDVMVDLESRAFAALDEIENTLRIARGVVVDYGDGRTDPLVALGRIGHLILGVTG